jgi:antitoxin ParD1/3/4
MPTRNVVLTDHLDAFVEQLVQRGSYQNASEVLREGLRLVEQREVENTVKLELLRQAAQTGELDFAAGRFQAFESSVALKNHLNTLACGAIGGL